MAKQHPKREGSYERNHLAEKANALYRLVCSDLRQENVDHHQGCVCPHQVCFDLNQREYVRDCYVWRSA